MSRFIQCEKSKQEGILHHWQELFARDKAAQSAERELFAARERAYRGIKGEDEEVYKTPEGEELSHGYNITYENIEAQIDGTVYPVKVTCKHKGGEALAKKIEHRLNDIFQRSTMKIEVDVAERIVPIQGGAYWHGEWDNDLGTRASRGDFVFECRHPINIIPQHGANKIKDMNRIFTEIGMERSEVKRTFGIEVKDEGEETPEARSAVGDSVSAEDFVTVRTGYFKNESGGIGKIVWCGDTLLYYADDYEAKRLYRCEGCGATLSEDDFEGDNETKTVSLLKKIFGRKDAPTPICSECGSKKWKLESENTETVEKDVIGADGTVIVPQGTVIPTYRPRMLPFVLQKSVSAANELLGLSDADTIEGQQSKIDFACRKIDERIDASRPFISLPPDLSIEPGDGVNYIRPDDPAAADMVRVVDVRLDISPFLAMKNEAYQEARHLIGITDSYQGRYDSSAKSGVAKQASAAQAAGRLQSKRNVKAAAFADMYEMAFKFILAYDGGPREVIYRDDDGKLAYETFNRLEFLRKDAGGAWYFDDEFNFDVDMSLALEQDRTALWQQTANDYAAGLYGQPGSLDALIMLWKRREFLHYPLAGETLREFEAQKENMRAAPQALPSGEQGTMGGVPPMMN